jgi:hypothetical protein
MNERTKRVGCMKNCFLFFASDVIKLSKVHVDKPEGKSPTTCRESCLHEFWELFTRRDRGKQISQKKELMKEQGM